MKYIEDFKHPDINNLTGSVVIYEITRNYPELYQYIIENKGDDAFVEFMFRMYHHMDNKPICVVCGNQVKFKTLHLGYARTCGRACTAKDPQTIQKSKQTILTKYGVENISQLESIQNIKRQHSMEKYGVDSPNKVDSIKKKQHENHKKSPTPKKKRTIREKHWTNREKCQKTMMERYGVTSLFEKPEFQEKIRHIKEQKYGDKFYTNRKKYNQTCLEKYGMEWGINKKEFQDKARKTTIERYGAPYTFMNMDFQNKIRKNILKKYGVNHVTHLNSVKNKINKTCLEKYGVEWSCMLPEARIYSGNSKPNQIFAKLLDKYHIEYEREFSLGKYSYDFKINDILIEINPWPTHNIDWSPFGNPIKKDYHKVKSNFAINDHGYKCICIWDWDDMETIIKTFILPKTNKYHARKCICKEVPLIETLDFLKKNHIQGACRNIKTSIGLYYDDSLIGIMCWGKPRYNKKSSYELLRMCYVNDVLVVGGTKKMFNYFIEKYHPQSLVSYCDLSKFTGNIYSELGFIRSKNTSPSIHWINSKNIHITNNLLNQRGFDQLFNTNYGKGVSNQQLMLEHGFVRIYDCGQDTFTWCVND